MKYPRILSAIRSARWAITPASLQAITDTLGAHLRGDLRMHHRARADDHMHPEEGAAPAESRAATLRYSIGSIAVIKVYGILGKHLSGLETACGGIDVDAIAAELDACAADPSVLAIVLDFDSPGGTVTGIPELAARIRATAKPVYAFTSSQCCSAAYWLAASCRQVYCTPSSDVGSIGVYIALCDDSEWWKKEGYKLELIKAGKFKAMGISGQPLADEERALLQADVDRIYAMFAADIRVNRPGVADETMQGQTFMGAHAVAAGLAGETVPDINALLPRLLSVG